MFLGLIVFFLVPTLSVYPRTALLESAGTEALSVIGHIEWFDLINETIQAFLLVPMYHLFYKAKTLRRFWREVKEKTVIAGVIYIVLSILVVFNLSNLMDLMQVSHLSVEETEYFLGAETVSFLLKFFASIIAIVFTVLGQPLFIFLLSGVECISTLVLDQILIPRFLVYGAAYSDIGAGVCTMIFALVVILSHPSEPKSKGASIPFLEWARIGIFSGLQVLLDNIVYMLIVVKMITAVAEQGNYWVANNFIWGLLLIPVTALAELVKREYQHEKTLKYCLYSMLIFASWIVLFPAWPWLLTNLFGITNTEPIIAILRILVPFYLAYNLSAMMSSTFIAMGRTDLNFIVSIVVNIGYYGIFYGAYLLMDLDPTTTFACILFGGGMIVNCICSMGLLAYVQKKTGRS